MCAASLIFRQYPSSLILPGSVNMAIFEPKYLKFQNYLGYTTYWVLWEATLSYNVYIVGYVQQVSFLHNIHHPPSYPGTVNIGNIWNPISQVLKLLGIYHLLGFIRGTLGYNLNIVGYVQLVPFFHNIHHPSSYPGTVNLGNIWSPISQAPKLLGVHHLHYST